MLKSLILCLIILPTFAHADVAKDCEAGFKNIKKIRISKEPWADLLKYYNKYVPKCDDGYYAEGTADLVMTLLEKWQDFSGLVQQSKNEKFFNYVLSNISSTGDESDVKKLSSIQINVLLNRKPFVKKMNEAAQSTLEEMKL